MPQSDDSPSGDWDFLESGDQTIVFEKELRAEVGRGHVLDNVHVVVIARRRSQDDILVAVSGRPGVASVHLVWSGKPESAPYPITRWHASVEDAIQQLASD